MRETSLGRDRRQRASSLSRIRFRIKISTKTTIRLRTSLRKTRKCQRRSGSGRDVNRTSKISKISRTRKTRARTTGVATITIGTTRLMRMRKMAIGTTSLTRMITAATIRMRRPAVSIGPRPGARMTRMKTSNKTTTMTRVVGAKVTMTIIRKWKMGTQMIVTYG